MFEVVRCLVLFVHVCEFLARKAEFGKVSTLSSSLRPRFRRTHSCVPKKYVYGIRAPDASSRPNKCRCGFQLPPPLTDRLLDPTPTRVCPRTA